MGSAGITKIESVSPLRSAKEALAEGSDKDLDIIINDVREMLVSAMKTFLRSLRSEHPDTKIRLKLQELIRLACEISGTPDPVILMPQDWPTRTFEDHELEYLIGLIDYLESR